MLLIHLILSRCLALMPCDSLLLWELLVRFVLYYRQPDLNLSTERLTANKAFTNKLWNAGKFVLQVLPNRYNVSSWQNIEACKLCVSTGKTHTQTINSRKIVYVRGRNP
ncbi:hypothetical protein ERO13_D07G000261v2 [Gossypium hirsutum]|nr:hypothetical protein ERO13_D07G000261v2 [Gossypium hirsutum]